MVPWNVVEDISEKIGGQLAKYLKVLAGIVITALLLHLLYFYTPHVCICLIWRLGLFSNAALSWFISHINTTVVICLVIGYLSVLALWFLRPVMRSRYFITSIVILLQVSIFFVIQALFVAGFVVELRHIQESKKRPKELYQQYACRSTDANSLVVMSLEKSTSFRQYLDITTREFHQNLKLYENFELRCKKDVSNSIIFVKISDNSDPAIITTGLLGSVASTCKDPSTNYPLARKPIYNQPVPLFSPASSGSRAVKTRALRLEELRSEQLEVSSTTHAESNMYIYAVLYACVAMLMYKHSLFLQLCPIPIFIYFVKHLGGYLGVWSFLRSQTMYVMDQLVEWSNTRLNAIFPAPVTGLFKLGVTINSKLMETLNGSVDSAASVFVIFGITLFAIVASILLAIQVYAEGIHMVYMGASVINSTVVRNSDMLGVVPEDWQEKVNSILDNAYMYGRDGISKMVRGWMKNVEEEKAVQFEKQILELWDRVYQAWLMSSTEKTVGPVFETFAALSKMSDLEDFDHVFDIVVYEIFNVNAMIAFAKENVEMLMSLLESVWSILKDNMSLALHSFTAMLSIVFGGGTAVLNFILDMVVFLTALFYLLSSSGELYKPVELITNFSPNMGNRFATAIETAVVGVFRASFKMAVFYGLWTWLIHNLFDVKVIYLPSVLAATFSVVPFVGTYWACLPACLDLWLGEQREMQAILLFVFQFLPTSVVDSAIYKEIKGGGHPYLTGLSIAGGIFCLGAEGAIIGPLLLCGLFVAINMSSSLMKESPSDTNFSTSLNRMTLSERITHLNQLKRMDTVL
ncbi:hypothetical protein L9F63_009762 [Diploptera punctata]|uniref:Transmembrane protein n=1 Tax=Diploptera punctata TaxID=6984 RepID=A0AAD8AIR2_DIPPU|nr:hypothetical protein L9F63_009762 [Diploptera punctata]